MCSYLTAIVTSHCRGLASYMAETVLKEMKLKYLYELMGYPYIMTEHEQMLSKLSAVV